jgi:hypothetical protein
MYPGSTGNGDSKRASVISGRFGGHGLNSQANFTSSTSTKNPVVGGGHLAHKLGIIGAGNMLVGNNQSPLTIHSNALVTVSEYNATDLYNNVSIISNYEDQSYRITKKQMKNLHTIFMFYAALHQPITKSVKFTFEEIQE